MTDKPVACGVVVTYQPTADVVENLRAIVAECGRVLVVDNGSAREICDRIGTLPGLVLLRLGENLGVATALNRGAIWARENGFLWMITFDQDSRPEPGMLDVLWATHVRHPEAAVVGPRIREEGAGGETAYRWVRQHPHASWLFQRVECSDRDLSGVTLLVSSGSLIDLDLWESLVGFDEGLFIDYVDTDYCLKVRRAGRTLVVAASATLHHRLGARQPGRLLGRDLRPMHHAAFRHYYMARNRVTMWRRHAVAVPHWACFDLAFALLNGFRVVAFEPDKWSKCKAMVLGTWDGLFGRSGPCPDDRLRALQP